MKIRVELEFDTESIELHTLAYYLGRNTYLVCNAIFKGNDKGIKGDEQCSYEIIKIERK